MLDDNPSPASDTLAPQPTPGAAPGPLLAVVGSRHPATAAQVAAACQADASLVQPGADFYFNSEGMGVAATAARVAEVLAKNEVVVLATDPDAALRGPKNKRSLLARKLGQAAAQALEQVSVAGLFPTGGDTALAVCQALGATRLRLGGEIEPGIPWGRLEDGRFPGLAVVTKAGGFGQAESLLRAVTFLRGEKD